MAASQALTPPRRVTRALSRSLVQTFLTSPVVASDCRLETVWATSCSSPLKADVETVLAPHPARPVASSAKQLAAQRCFGRLRRWSGGMVGAREYATAASTAALSARADA